MVQPTVESLRKFTNGFEYYTFDTSQSYASQCDDLDELVQSIDDNLTLAERDWDSRQVWDYDDNNDLIIGTITGYNQEEDVPIADAFLRIVIPDDWK